MISKRGLLTLTAKHPDTEIECLDWYRIAAAATWTRFDDVRADYPSVDLVGQVLIFNIGRNRYRLIATVFFATHEIYIKALLTHKEYDREEWKKWC